MLDYVLARVPSTGTASSLGPIATGEEGGEGKDPLFRQAGDNIQARSKTEQPLRLHLVKMYLKESYLVEARVLKRALIAEVPRLRRNEGSWVYNHKLETYNVLETLPNRQTNQSYPMTHRADTESRSATAKIASKQIRDDQVDKSKTTAYSM